MMEEQTSCCVIKEEKMSSAAYWDANFAKTSKPNWNETQSPWVMPWISNLNLSKDAMIFCAGVGESNIVESLLSSGFKNIIANDISAVAIEKLRKRVQSDKVTYLVDNLVQPEAIQEFRGKIDLYIDRATLHFFTTCSDKDHYFQQMSDLLKPSGYSVLGVFSKDNKAKCCGLDLQLWSEQSLKNRMSDYSHIDIKEIPFTEMNGNVRNYLYLLAQKN